MTVKADSKGRLTGAIPETRYTRKNHPDGRVEYIPEMPNEFDAVRDVTQEQFEAFFGFNPEVVSRDSVQVEWVKSYGKWIPNGIAFEVFKVTESGERVVEESEVQKDRVLIRIARTR